MHQPDYREPNSGRFAMPWVRLHAIKDYLDMPLRAAVHENVRVTFNLVPSLLDQIEAYASGALDNHLELTLRPARQLSHEDKLEILDTFFSAHPANMITPHQRYDELYKKANGNATPRTVLPSLFSSQEFLDLQVWSNLAWVDPMFRSESLIRRLFDQQKHYTEEDKQELIAWQREFCKRIIPTYQQLYAEGKIDISFTPYYHPILPLLCDTDSALEALPGLKLPRERFRHPEDAREQVRRSAELFEKLFGKPLTGMWPSEGSVSEEALQILIDQGLKWAATDEEILFRSLAKSGLPREEHPLQAAYSFRGLRLLFRDHGLSDRIGFVYAGWQASEAVADFIQHIHHIRTLFADRLDSIVVPVILDGENAWEYFPNDGAEFLDQLYRVLAHDNLIETVTMTDAAAMPATELSSIFAGSWINHNFRIWIGHHEDNAAWDLLTQTRKALTDYIESNPSADPDVLAKAWNQIFVAEGSDWCWWYGDEHRGAHNAEFDTIYRRHLMGVYKLIGREIPHELMRPIHGVGPASFTTMPDGILTAQVDGRITHYYEWSGAGFFDCTKAGGAMHRVERHVGGIHFAYDHNRFYIRLDFVDRNRIDLLQNLRFEIALFQPNPQVISIDPARDGFTGGQAGEHQFALGEILELAVERSFLWDAGFGSLGFSVSLYDANNKLESWPEADPITVDVPEPNKEIFWPS